jgi:NAD+ diphosphatase
LKIAKTVTFAGGRADRAAELRPDAAALRALAAREGARLIGLVGGQPLLCDPGSDPGGGPGAAPRLARLALGGAPPEGAVFLGREGAEGLWAAALPAAPEGTRAADLRGVMTELAPDEAERAVTARALLGWHASHGFCAACGAPSRPTRGGWQRDCPACGAHHFPRTDPVVIMLVTRGEEVLLGRSPGWPSEMHSLLAGFMEPGETLEAAVRREVREETGVRVGAVAYLASQPWPFPASLMLGARAEALSRELRLDPDEIESALWVPRERMARIFRGADPVIRAPRRGAIASFLLWNWLADRLG